MSKVPYPKLPLTYDQQLQQLKDRGLRFRSEKKGLHLLERLSYYRLSGYWYPLLEDKEAHIFKRNAEFETAFRIYRFDRDLRIFILKELEKIEVAIRAQMIYVLSHQHSSFWFRDNTIFKADFDLDKSLNILLTEFKKSDEAFIKSFKAKYSNSYPPSWMCLELTSFGTLSMLYTGLRPGKPKRDIAHFFGLDDKTFSSWLHCLVYLRNVCAHHSRFWNREMQIAPKIPLKPTKTWLDDSSVANNKAYFILSMILYLLQSINSNHQFIFRLKVLLKKYPNIDLTAMGFPAKWKSEPLWKHKLTLKQRIRLIMARPE